MCKQNLVSETVSNAYLSKPNMVFSSEGTQRGFGNYSRDNVERIQICDRGHTCNTNTCVFSSGEREIGTAETSVRITGKTRRRRYRQGQALRTFCVCRFRKLQRSLIFVLFIGSYLFRLVGYTKITSKKRTFISGIVLTEPNAFSKSGLRVW